MYEQVHIFQYSTESSFDAFLWQTQEKKQMFISQIMNNDFKTREFEDVDETALEYSEIKALCCGDNRVKEKADIDNDVQKLQLEKSSYIREQETLKNLLKITPGKISNTSSVIDRINKDINLFKVAGNEFGVTINGINYVVRKEAAKALDEAIRNCNFGETKIGKFKSIDISLLKSYKNNKLRIHGNYIVDIDLSSSNYGNIQRLENVPDKYMAILEQMVINKQNLEQQLQNCTNEVGKPFPRENELAQKLQKQAKLTFELENEVYEVKENNNEKVNTVAASKEPVDKAAENTKKVCKEMER